MEGRWNAWNTLIALRNDDNDGKYNFNIFIAPFNECNTGLGLSPETLHKDY